MFIATILMLALTRAEILERFKAPVITKAEGLVQVFADCPRDMREEFQMPVATFVSDICRKLEGAKGANAPRFAQPGIIVYIGEERTNRTDVVTLRRERGDGTRYTCIYLPAPAYSDVKKLRLEVVKAFVFAMEGKELDDDGALQVMVESDPLLKAESYYEKVRMWQKGFGSGDDEEYLKLVRSVLIPGVARTEDVTRFASRLFLYPHRFAHKFCGKYDSLSFADAIELAEIDPRIRFAAYDKAPLVVIYGGGHGEEMSAAADAYSQFLFDLARFKKSKEELKDQLEEADIKLNVALEKAREYEKDNY